MLGTLSMNLTNLQAKRVLKKRKAESVIANAIMLTLAIAVVFLLLKVVLNYYTTLHAVEEVHAVARNYLLKMELNNCLEQSDVDALVKTLIEHDVTDIKLSGNFSDTVTSTYIERNEHVSSYGQAVYLKVTGIMNVDVEHITFFGIEIDISKPTVNLAVTKKGVAVK